MCANRDLHCHSSKKEVKHELMYRTDIKRGVTSRKVAYTNRDLVLPFRGKKEVKHELMNRSDVKG